VTAHKQFGGAPAQGHEGIDGGTMPPSRMAARGGRWWSSDNYCSSLPPPYLLLRHLPITSSLSLSLSLSPTSSRNRRVRPWVPLRAGWGIAGRSCRQSGGSCVFWLRLRQNAPENIFFGCFSRGAVLRTHLAGLLASHVERNGWEPYQTHPKGVDQQ
jgi:hypothetical protein